MEAKTKSSVTSSGWLGPRLWKRISQKLLRKLDSVQKENADYFSEAMRWADDYEEAEARDENTEKTLAQQKYALVEELIEEVTEEMEKKVSKRPNDTYKAGKIQAYGEVLVLLRAKKHALRDKNT